MRPTIIALLAAAAFAAFAAPAQAGHITVSISGSGSVADNAGQIACPPTCEADYQAGQVTFTASPGSGQRFAGWSGACAQYSGPQCTLNGDFDATIGAVFEPVPSDPPPGSPPPPPPQLDQVRVEFTSGFGRVTSVPGGIDCRRDGFGRVGGACVATFAVGTSVTLTADPGLGWAVAGWNVGCESFELSCTFTLRAGNGLVELTLAPRAPRPGEVSLGTQGDGVVRRRGLTDSVCLPVCTFALATTETATFVAEGVAGQSVFSHWTGDCRNLLNPRADCVLRGAYHARTATAMFRPIGRVTFRRQGQGVVRGTGIDCGDTCSARLDPARESQWRPIGNPGWVFDRWEGYCHNVSGRRECDAREQPGTLTSTAVFRRAVRRGFVRLSVAGPGRVHGSAGGRDILCREGTPCDIRLQDADEDNRRLNLHAVADDGARLVGWEGCPKSEFYRFTSRAEHCFTDGLYNEVREPEDRQMRAIFADVPRARLAVTGQGRITTCPRGEECDPETSIRVPAGGSGITIRAVPAQGWQFARWEEHCGRWDVHRPSVNECRLRDLWHDERVRAVFVRSGSIEVSALGGGAVRHVPWPGGTRGSDVVCRPGSPCVLTNLSPNLYRRLKAVPNPGWRFERWEGYCDRIFFNDECDVPGGPEVRSTRAVFVRT